MNFRVDLGLRGPTSHDTASFVSASIAVYVHRSPCPGFLAFFCFDPTNDQISSASTRLHGEIDQRVVLLDRAELPDLDQYPHHRVFIRPRHAGNRAQRPTLYKSANHCGATFN